MIDKSDVKLAAELEAASRQLETAGPQDVLRWALQRFGKGLTMATAFGEEGCCLIAMLSGLQQELGAAPDIFNLETGYQFAETLALRDELQERYGLPIRLVSSIETVAEMEARFGGPIYGTAPDQCCHIRKVVPLAKAVEGFDAWITAIRRQQTPERATAPIVGFDNRFDLVKINPLANWTKQQVHDYIQVNHVPTNPLHLQGYTSIGCQPCTRAITAGEDERAGRWAGTDKRECGLHWDTSGKLSHQQPPAPSQPAAAKAPVLF